MTIKFLWDHRGKEREIIYLSAEKINFQPRILYQLKIFFKNEDIIETIYEGGKLRDLLLREVHYRNAKGYFSGWEIVIPKGTIYLQEWMKNIRNDKYLGKYS